jgi:hypothetical protein
MENIPVVALQKARIRSSANVIRRVDRLERGGAASGRYALLDVDRAERQRKTGALIGDIRAWLITFEGAAVQ